MRKFLSCAALAAAALGGVSTSADAYVVLQVQAGAVTYNCSTLTGLTLANTTCNAGFGTITLGSDTIGFTGQVGTFDVTFLGRDQVIPGPVSILQTVNLSVTNTGSAGSTLTTALWGYDYTLPAGPMRTLAGSASYVSATETTASADTIVNNVSVDPNDAGAVTNLMACTLFLNGSSSPTGNPSSGNCDAKSASNSTLVNWNDPGGPFSPFSIREGQLFTLAAGQNVSGSIQANVADAPEPVSTSLVGAGLLALALSSRRRRALKA